MLSTLIDVLLESVKLDDVFNMLYAGDFGLMAEPMHQLKRDFTNITGRMQVSAGALTSTLERQR